ncbi:hypothetical protein LCL89_09665 [Halobacillus yeomjeoni]|uniref:hypothetical protein n=1 Tax=Halobacillus yeomjeoni TaxID=311194 RepID=UPI001CD4B5DF|nr:hypothetical protein [Halobacillus yeomjeoni]MCA0984312.1 hypothetical protein [Halobacillus yeomjeoni]
MKKFLGYFVFTAAMIALFVGLMNIRDSLVTLKDLEFKGTPLLLFTLLYPIGYGALFATHALWFRWKRGQRGFQWARFLGIGLPSLYMILAPLMRYIPPSMTWPLGEFLMNSLGGGVLLFGFLFGYICIDSIGRSEV